MGRSFGGALGVLLGRKAEHRFCFEITPQAVGDVPDGVTAVAVHWEKGSKVSYTEPAHVNPEEGTAVFAQVMRQTATIYKQGNTLLPKLYTFKVQSITSSTSTSSTESLPAAAAAAGLTSGFSSSRRTIARTRLDLAQFCSAESTPSPVTEICVPLEPKGTLTLSIKTVWLQHYDRARSAQLLQQEDESSSSSQAWGSSSDVHTDKSSVRSSMYGCAIHDADRDTCSGSAELDKLLQEAEAATAAKAVAPSTPGKTPPASTPALPPKVVTLHSLSTAPRGPSRPQHSRAYSTGTPGCHQPPQQQWGTPHTSRSVLDILDQPHSLASPFQGLTPDSIEAGSSGSSGSSSSSRRDGPSVFPFGRKSQWHRRVSSAPDTATILEADKEGPDGSSFTGLQRPGPVSTAAGAGVLNKPLQQDNCDSGARLPFGMRPSARDFANELDDFPSDAEDEGEEDATAQWMQACRPSPAASGSSSGLRPGFSDGPEGLRSLSGRMPTWLWPSSRLAVRDLTTDQIMRRIGCSRDVSALQHMCRGLLCERNDWRFRATQAERINEGLQQELQQLRGSQAGAHQQQQQQQQQLSEGQLLARLVDAKLQLAQADLTTQALKGQLERERKRHMQALARLTNMQATLDELIHEQNAANLTGAGCQPGTVGCCG